MDKGLTTNDATQETLALETEAAQVENEPQEQPTSQIFDPSRYLTRIDGRDYLEVKWRLLWMRTEYPTARIATELARFEEGFALFRAEVTLPNGASATGWGSETVHDFSDYIEAAETKALGRALAALGFGTQFTRDFDFTQSARADAPALQIVDSPVGPFNPTPFEANNGRHLAAVASNTQQPLRSGTTLTEKQLKAIYAIARATQRLSEQQVDARCLEMFNCRPDELSKAEASQFIDALKNYQAA